MTGVIAPPPRHVILRGVQVIAMNKLLTTFAAATVLFVTVCLAATRSPGKYSGVVVFDRWGGCTLYSGIYVMYISEGVKEQLRANAGKCVQIDATQVEQPLGRGDGLIRKLTLLGPAPPAKASESPEGLKITVARAFEDGTAPQFVIRVENVSDQPKALNMNSLAPTLLAAKTKARAGSEGLSPSDGPSTAVVTREDFWLEKEGAPRLQGESETWQWKVIAPEKLEKDVALKPKAVFELRLSFKVPSGEYEFLAGYGGGAHAGECIASNRLGFDVKQDGTAVMAKAAGR
jgi:hypothetical protein